MKKKHALIRMIVLCGVLVLPHSHVLAEELDIVNRPINTSGLTGLLFTTAPYTLPSGTVEIGAGVLHERNDRPNYTVTKFPLAISVGLPNNSEISIKSSYLNVKEPPAGTPATSKTQRKTGNAELSYKWNFLRQPEDSVRPAVAFIATGILPTDTYRDGIINGVNHWGIRIGLSTGTEISFYDYLLGIYADAQFQGQDMTQKEVRDNYGIWNLGILFPVSKYKNLQLFIEYSQVFGRDRTTLEGGDYYGITYGIRLVSERMNFTVGTQFQRKQADGYDNSSRLLGMVSMKL
jgi:hypothetical protein